MGYSTTSAIFFIDFRLKMSYLCSMKKVKERLNQMISYKGIVDGLPKKRDWVTVEQAMELAQLAYNQGVMKKSENS